MHCWNAMPCRRRGSLCRSPTTFGRLLGSRLASLSAGVRDTLLLVAAAVRPTVGLLGSASQRSENARSNLDGAVAASVIELDDETVRFTHPLFASTVYAKASSEERRSPMAARSRRRRRRGARTAFGLGARGPDEEVAAALDLAASAAFGRGAPDSAADLEDLAVRLTPAADERSIRSRSLRVSTYRFSAGDVRAAREVLEGLIDATPLGPERAGLRFELSNLVWNDVERVRRLLAEAREDAGEEMSVELDARVELAMGWVGQMGGDLAEGSRHGRNALAAAEALDDPRLVIEALTFLGFDEFLMGRPTRSILERAISLTDAVGPQPVRIDSARRVLGATLMWGGALDEARAELERDHAETVRSGGLTYQWEELVYLAELELRAGNWDLAAQYASQGLESTVETGLEEAREVHLWSTALVAAHRGDIETARANASEGLRIAEAHGDVFHVVTNRSALGFLELSLGNAQDAHGWLGPLVELTDRWGLRQPSAFPFLPTRSRPWSSLAISMGQRPCSTGLRRKGKPSAAPSRSRQARVAAHRSRPPRRILRGPSTRSRKHSRTTNSFRSRSISPAPSSPPGRSCVARRRRQRRATISSEPSGSSRSSELRYGRPEPVKLSVA